MNKRIRYVNMPDGKKKSMRQVTSTSGVQYSVELDGVHATIEGDDGTVVNCGATSEHKIKIGVKDALVELGCVFEKEVRKKRGSSEANS